MAIALEGLLGPALGEVLTNSSATIFTYAGTGALTVIEDAAVGGRTIQAELGTGTRQAIYTLPVAADKISFVFERRRPTAPTVTHEIVRLYAATARPLAVRENADGKVSVVINTSTVAWTSTASLGTTDDAAYVRYSVYVDRIAQTWQLAIYAGSSTTPIETSPVFTAQTGLGTASFTTMQYIQPATADAHTAYWRRFRIKSGADATGLDTAAWAAETPPPDVQVPTGSAPWQNTLAGPLGTAVTKANTAPMGTDFDFVVVGAGSTATYVDLPWGDRGVRLSVASATDSTYTSWYDPAATAERGVLVLPLWLDTVPSAAQVPIAQIRNVDQGIMGMLKLDNDVRAGRLTMSEAGGADVTALRGSTVLQASHLYWVGMFVDKGTSTTTGELGWILWDTDRETILETMSATGRNTGTTSPAEYRVGAVGPSSVIPRSHYLAEIQGGPMASGWPARMLAIDTGLVEAEPFLPVAHRVVGAASPVWKVDSTVPANLPLPLQVASDGSVSYKAPALLGGATVTLRVTDSNGAEALVTDTIMQPSEYEASLTGLIPLQLLDGVAGDPDPENPTDPPVVEPVLPTPTDLRVTEFENRRLRMEIWGGKADPTVPSEIPASLASQLQFVWREKGSPNPVETTTVPWRETGLLAANNADGTARTYEYDVQLVAGGITSARTAPATIVLASAAKTLDAAGQTLVADWPTNGLTGTTVATLAPKPGAAGAVILPTLTQTTAASQPALLDDQGRKFLRFNGTSHRLTGGASAAGQNVSGVTFHALVRMAPATGAGQRDVFQVETGTGVGRFTAAIVDGKMRLAGRRLDSNSLVTVTGTTDLRDNLWHHVAYIEDFGNARAIGYLDGVVEFDAPFQTAGLSSNTASNRLGIGSQAGTVGELFVGDLMHPVVYHGAQTAAQVAYARDVLDDEIPPVGPTVSTQLNAPTTTSLSWTFTVSPAAPLTHTLFDNAGNVVKTYSGVSATTHTVNYTGLASGTSYPWQARATGTNSAVTTVTGTTSTTSVPTGALKWARLHPILANPLTDHVNSGWQKLVYSNSLTSCYFENDQGVKGPSLKFGGQTLGAGTRTYVVPPSVPFKIKGGLTLVGGHDVQWIGGEMNQTDNYSAAEWNGTNGTFLSGSARKAMQWNACTGDQYMEGLWIHGAQVGDVLWPNMKATTITGRERLFVIQNCILEDARALNLPQQDGVSDIGNGPGIDDNGVQWGTAGGGENHSDDVQIMNDWNNSRLALYGTILRSSLQGVMNNAYTSTPHTFDFEKVLIDMCVATGEGLPVKHIEDFATEAAARRWMDASYAVLSSAAKVVLGPDVTFRWPFAIPSDGGALPKDGRWAGVTRIRATPSYFNPGAASNANPSWKPAAGTGYLATVTG